MSNTPTSVVLAHPLLAAQAVRIGLTNRDYGVGETVVVTQTIAISLQRYGLISGYTFPPEPVPASLEQMIADAVDVAFLASIQMAAAAAVGDLLAPAASSAASAALSSAVSLAIPPLIEDALDARDYERQFINVRDHGALGDGTTDCTAAIQSALNLARDSNGGWVYIPQGTYLLSTNAPLRIYKNTRLTLAPNATLRRDTNSSMLTNGDAGQALGAYSGHGNIIIEGGLWDMQGALLEDAAVAMSLGHGDNVTVQNLVIRDVPRHHAIELNAMRGVRVLNCRFKGFSDSIGDRDFSEAIQIDLAKGAGFFGQFGPYDHTPCVDILIQGCFFGASFTPGTTAWPRGIGSHASTAGVEHKQIAIIGNTFDGLGQYAVGGYNWSQVAVTANRIANCGAGIRMRTIDTNDPNDTKTAEGVQTNASQVSLHWAIIGNTIAKISGIDDPILIRGEATGRAQRVAVIGNSIDDANGAETGIRVIWADFVTVQGNCLTNLESTGISMSDVTECVAADNVVRNADGNGIALSSCDDVSVNGNRIRLVGQNGVYVTGSKDIMVAHNAIKAAGRLTNDTYSGIRVVTETTFTSIVGNQIRPNGSGNEAAAGITITNTCSAMRRYGNGTGGLGIADTSDAFASSADN